jgi:hypothetical protein
MRAAAAVNALRVNLRTASYVSLCSAPVVFVILRVIYFPLLPQIGLLCVVCGFILGIATWRRAGAAGDGASKGRAACGVILNGLYLLAVIYLIFVVIPAMRRDAQKLLEESRRIEQQSPAPSPSSPP